MMVGRFFMLDSLFFAYYGQTVFDAQGAKLAVSVGFFVFKRRFYHE